MDLFKLLGTIAVNNADALKALRETSGEGEKTEGKLSKAFSSLGKGAAVVGKTIATGLAVGATAMAGLTTKALQLSGDLEQNMGGAEAVFGELGKTIGDMKTPMQVFNAETGKVETQMQSLETVSKQAFQNMGLSQSDYLATANKMGALFKGAGFETQEALDLSSQAMQRAADVASIMGIDTEAAMEAVAGAAKGNFTMMDNLGVAMNDTAIGAYALEKGINKTTAEMTQQEKIGLAMEMFMDKTAYAAGNYAKENATLAGSLGTAKAALTNFLAGSGDVDSLVSSFSNLANVVVNSLTEIAPRLTQGLSDLVQQVVPLIPPLLNTLLPVLVEGAVTLINGLVAAIPGILTALLNVLPALIDGVTQIVDALVAALPQIIEALVSALPTLIPALVNGLVTMIVSLCAMLPQIIQPIIDYLPEIIAAIVTALINNLPALIQGAVQLVGALIAALPQIFMALVEAIVLIFQGIWESIKNVFAPVGEWFSNMWDSMGSVPGLSSMKTMIENVWKAIKTHIQTVTDAIKTVITTIWNSIKSVISTVLNSIKTVIQTAWNAVKTIISNVMSGISSVLKGDWEGVKKSISNILDAIKSVVKSIWEGIKNTISSVLNGIKSIVSAGWNAVTSVVKSCLNTAKSIVTSVWNGIKGAISGALNGIKTTVTKGFNEVKSKVTGAFKDLPSKLKSIGSDLISGLWNGISDKFTWLTGKMKEFANNVTDKLKGFFGIHSPSTVMRDEVGKNLALGIVEGIEKETAALEGCLLNVVKDSTLGIKKNLQDFELRNAVKFIEEKTIEALEAKFEYLKENNAATLADEVAFWETSLSLFEDGTEEKIKAEEKYNDATKRFNQENIKIAKENSRQAKNLLNSYATANLQTAEKVLKDYKEKNEMTLAEEVGFWDAVRQACYEGTQSRIDADNKYFEAKKALDEKVKAAEEELQKSVQATADKIIAAEEELQKAIQATQKKLEDRKKAILESRDLFSTFGWEYVDTNDLFKNISSQMSAMDMYEEKMADLEERIGGTALFERLSSMGVDDINEIRAFAAMTDVQLKMYSDKYDKLAEKSKKFAEKELGDEVASEIEQAYKTYYAETEKAAVEMQKTYQTFSDKCAELGVQVIDDTEAMKTSMITSFDAITTSVATATEDISVKVGENMLNSLGAVKTSLDEMKKAFENWQPDMKLPHFKIEGKLDLATGSVPTATVEWYKKAMDNAVLLNKPTIFGYNASTGNLMGGGEAGSEVVAGSQTLMNMIQNAVAEQNNGLVTVLSKILKAIVSMDSNMGGHMRKALENTALELNKREFARIVKAVN